MSLFFHLWEVIRVCCCAFIGGYMCVLLCIYRLYVCAVVHLWEVIFLCSFAFVGDYMCAVVHLFFYMCVLLCIYRRLYEFVLSFMGGYTCVLLCIYWRLYVCAVVHL